MSKGKRQRQRERAKQKAQEAAERRLIVEKEEMAKDHAESATQTASNPLPAKKTRWWVRFWNYLCEKSSFTDWCIAAFTCVLMTVAVYQYKVMDGQLQALIAQLDVMQKDQRAWMEIDPANENDFFKTAQTGDPLRQLAKIKNIGKTPARMIVVKAMSELLPATEEPILTVLKDNMFATPTESLWASCFPMEKQLSTLLGFQMMAERIG